MESLRRARRELQRIVQSASAGSRFAAVSAVAVGVAVASGLVLQSTTGDLVPLVDAAGFTEAESAVVLEQISAAGLPKPVARDGQLLVPESDRDRYRDLIQDSANSPPTWAESWEEANSALSRFSLSAEREDIEEITRAKLTSRLLNELPDIEQADVIWDEERQPGWNRPPLVHATVYLRPRPGHRITLETVHAVRLAVAGSKAYLAPEDVVVMDLSTMVAFDHESLGADFTARYGQITRLTAEYRQRAEDAVSHIPGATVAVAIERIIGDRQDVTNDLVPPPQTEPELTIVDAPRATFHQGKPNTGLEILTEPRTIAPVDIEITSVAASAAHVEPPTPGRHVTVSVSIPSSHYQQTAAARRLLPAATQDESARILADIEQEVIGDVRTRLARIETQVDLLHSRPTVLVRSIETKEFPVELRVAQPEAPVTATILARSRGALIAVTALISCWLIWTVVRMLAARSDNPPPVTRPAARQPSPENSDASGPPQEAAATTAENAPEFISRIPADQLTDVLNSGHDEIMLKRIVPPADPNRRWSPEVEQWDIDELAELPDAQLIRLVRSVAIDMWPAALSPAAPSTRRRLLSALPDGEADQLREVLDHVRPVRLDDIDQAQLEVQSALSAC